MTEITEAFRLFRECARTLWNVFLRPYADGEHHFWPVEKALFEAMLQSQLSTYEPERSIEGRGHHPGIRVEPNSADFEVLTAIDEGNSWRWTSETWHAGDVTLRYVGLFDFETFSGRYREFRYVETIAVDVRGGVNTVGQRALLPADQCRLYDVSPPFQPTEPDVS